MVKWLFTQREATVFVEPALSFAEKKKKS